MNIEQVIIRPAITEKGTYLIDKSKYLFYVNKKAGKSEIAKAIKRFYKVDAVKINIISGKGKKKRVGKFRKFTQLSDYKKCVVTVKKDQKIEGFESVKE